MSKLYLAYGSNLNKPQMATRCRDSVPVAPVLMPGTRLTFSGVLTVEKDKRHTCPAAIYRVSLTDELALDRYEGFPRLYSKRVTHVTIGTKREAVFYYVLNPPYQHYVATQDYYACVLDGYNDWGLDITVLRTAHKHALAAEQKAGENLYKRVRGRKLTPRYEVAYPDDFSTADMYAPGWWL